MFLMTSFGSKTSVCPFSLDKYVWQPLNIKPNVAYLNDKWEPCYWLTALFGNSFRGGHVTK